MSHPSASDLPPPQGRDAIAARKMNYCEKSIGDEVVTCAVRVLFQAGLSSISESDMSDESELRLSFLVGDAAGGWRCGSRPMALLAADSSAADLSVTRPSARPPVCTLVSDVPPINSL